MKCSVHREQRRPSARVIDWIAPTSARYHSEIPSRANANPRVIAIFTETIRSATDPSLHRKPSELFALIMLIYL